MRKPSTFKNRKIVGMAAVAALLVGSLGTAAYAAGGVNLTPKNVLMTQKVSYLKSNIQEKTPVQNDQKTISGPVHEDQAYKIAEQALKQMFGASVDGMEKTAIYFDEQKVKADQEYQAQNYPDKKMAFIPEFKNPYWVVTYNIPVKSEDPASVKKARETLLTATVDAETGAIVEILDFSKSTQFDLSASSSKIVSTEAAAQTAKEFLSDNGLLKGAAIKDVETLDYASNLIQVLVQLDNGQTDSVGVDKHSGAIINFQADLGKSQLEFIKSEASNPQS